MTQTPYYPTKPRGKRRFIVILLLIVVAAGIYHFTREGDAAPAAQAGGAPAVPVGVQTIAEQNVRDWSEFSGRMQAVDFAEIRPEVSGRITSIKFTDGQTVRAGTILLVIDPQPYEAAVKKAEANLASARTNAQFAKIELNRAAGMVKTQAIAKRLYDERANSDRVATAAVSAAEAELKQARIDLDRAYVKAPISGRVSRAEITVGNVVQAGPTAPVLTSIVSDNGIYADFEVDEQTYMNSMRTVQGGRQNELRIPVELNLHGDQSHVYEGTIYSFDNRIDTVSGTIRARAKFANEDRSLMPGMFVSVRVGSTSDKPALLVSERALGTDQNKRFVYVVDNESKATYREITLGKQIGAERVVLSGLQAGDRVIVDGIQHVRPDSVVDAKEITATTEQPAIDTTTAKKIAAH